MLGLMKRVNLVKYAMTPNRIINKTSDFEYHIANPDFLQKFKVLLGVGN